MQETLANKRVLPSSLLKRQLEKKRQFTAREHDGKRVAPPEVVPISPSVEIKNNEHAAQAKDYIQVSSKGFLYSKIVLGGMNERLDVLPSLTTYCFPLNVLLRDDTEAYAVLAFCRDKWRSALQSAIAQLGDSFGSDYIAYKQHEYSVLFEANQGACRARTSPIPQSMISEFHGFQYTLGESNYVKESCVVIEGTSNARFFVNYLCMQSESVTIMQSVSKRNSPRVIIHSSIAFDWSIRCPIEACIQGTVYWPWTASSQSPNWSGAFLH